MNEEVITERVKQVEAGIKEIKDDLKTMPDKIAEKINDSVDIKIKLAISETEKKYQAKLIGLLIAILGEGVALLIKFIMG
ncbi:MAG: hypothetical protein IKO48_07945 [Elusimicrobia bacterium]|nr:hypothetical protein [Elusimicrobiota bacterium]